VTKEDLLYAQVESRLTDYLKAVGVPMWDPALTVCPHCGEHASILVDRMWCCQHCKKSGDVVDYVMAYEHISGKAAAIYRVCRLLGVKITTLDVIAAEELMDTQLGDKRMLVDKMIGQGVYLVAGAPKTGKSYLVLWIAHCVSTGANVWGHETYPGDVLYISLEDNHQRLQERLAKITNGETGRIWIATEAELVGEGLEEQLAGFLGDHPTVSLVIIDTLQRIRQIHHDQYSYAGDYAVIGAIRSLADRFCITILVVHHTRKAIASDPFAMVSGTTGLTGSVDGTLVLLKNDRMDNRAKLFITGRDVEDLAMELYFDRDSTTWEFLGYSSGCGKMEKRDRLIDAVCALVDADGPFVGTASELFARLLDRTELQIKSPNALTRLLNPQTVYLAREYGICYSCERTAKERILRLQKMVE